MAEGKAADKKSGGDVVLASADDRGAPTVRVTERSIWDSKVERPANRRPRFDGVSSSVETGGATEVRGGYRRSSVQVATEVQLNGAVLGPQEDDGNARERLPWCLDPARDRPR